MRCSAADSGKKSKVVGHDPNSGRGESVVRSLEVISREVVNCTRCPELREYCRRIAVEKRRAFADWDYWGRPVPGFGDPRARMVIVGLAPAAHGANRTGRMFTGDRSGDFLYAALHRAGFANQPTSVSPNDGLKLTGVYITAPVRCAPPANKPTPSQMANCEGFLIRELEIIRPWVVICLGAIAWKAMLSILKKSNRLVPRPVPRFGHGSVVTIDDITLLGCYHVSQQNTFTGKLTPPMIDRILARAHQVVGAATAGKPAR